jgi:uncharacterized protein with GYD domain
MNKEQIKENFQKWKKLKAELNALGLSCFPEFAEKGFDIVSIVEVLQPITVTEIAELLGDWGSHDEVVKKAWYHIGTKELDMDQHWRLIIRK